MSALGLGHLYGKAYARQHPQSSCPFGGSRAKPTRLVAGSANASASAKKGLGAAKRAAWQGLIIGVSTEAQVATWLTEHGCMCRQLSWPKECACKAPRQLGERYEAASAATLFVDAGPDGTLRKLSLLAKFASADEAMATFLSEDKKLLAEVGPLTSRSGEATAAFLASAQMKQTVSEYARTDVYAKLSVTSFDNQYTLNEHLEDF